MSTGLIEIVIPLHHGGGRDGTDTELRFALRGLSQNLVGTDFRITIVGRALPQWLRRGSVVHLQCRGDLKEALKKAAARYPDGFIWTYDDHVLLRPTTAEQLRTPQYSNRRLSAGRTRWSGMLFEIRSRLRDEGFPFKDFSGPHGPYWFDKPMIDEAFEDLGEKMTGKYPFETWIINKRGIAGRPTQVYHRSGAFEAPPQDTYRYLNWFDGGHTPELLRWLASRFPDRSAYETVDYQPPAPERALKTIARDLGAVPGPSRSGPVRARTQSEWHEFQRPVLRSPARRIITVRDP